MAFPQTPDTSVFPVASVLWFPGLVTVVVV